MEFGEILSLLPKGYPHEVLEGPRQRAVPGPGIQKVRGS